MARTKFSGVLPPILTPLKDEDTIDVPALKRHADNLVNAGCHGIFVAGTTGEGPNLTLRSWRQAVEAVAEAVSGRVPLRSRSVRRYVTVRDPGIFFLKSQCKFIEFIIKFF